MFLSISLSLCMCDIQAHVLDCHCWSSNDYSQVKAKKRWSQVMYMSYILDFKQEESKFELYFSFFRQNEATAFVIILHKRPCRWWHTDYLPWCLNKFKVKNRGTPKIYSNLRSKRAKLFHLRFSCVFISTFEQVSMLLGYFCFIPLKIFCQFEMLMEP